jgi:hypothetical protein
VRFVGSHKQASGDLGGIFGAQAIPNTLAGRLQTVPCVGAPDVAVSTASTGNIHCSEDVKCGVPARAALHLYLGVHSPAPQSNYTKDVFLMQKGSEKWQDGAENPRLSWR